MAVEAGEHIVGCYLKEILKCDLVEYNVRPPGGKMKGLGELDVIGLDLKTDTVYLCEVTTWILGSSDRNLITKIKDKHERQIAYAEEYLDNFPNKIYMWWSPVISRGVVTDALEKVPTLQLIINEEYTKRFEELRAHAKLHAHPTGNMFFRFLQIMERLR